MIKHYLQIRYWLIALIMFSFSPAFGQQLAFPGAEGAGRFTTGGRGGEVYEVTNLNNSGPGSLRAGIDRQGPRTIVFRVSGTIALESNLQIRNGDLTIAGQTAPGDGIAIKGGGVVINANNIIIRYIRFRPGDILEQELDALWGRQQKDIIIDHCSMSWSTDEVGSFYDNENFTLQWSILSESLFESVHGKGRHGYGGIWGGKQASFHHNLLAHHTSRTPRFNGSRYTTTAETEIVDFRNNVIYNWGGNSAYGGEDGNQNMVANYYKPGPATGGGEKQYRIVDAYALDGELGRWYVTDNVVEGYPEVSANNWNGGVQRLTAAEEELARVDEPFPYEPVETHTAEEAYELVLANAGAAYPYRDPIDARVIEEVATGTATYGGAYGTQKGIIDTQETVGGWPELISAPAPEDTDQDGMPDAWETANGLDPNDPEDGKQIADNGYSNLENYLNEILETEPEDFLRHPSAITVGSISSNSIELSWIDNTEEETAIILERSADGETWEVIANLEANTTSFTDETVEPGQEYLYRLKAVSETRESAYSAAFGVQTPALPVVPERDALVGYWPFNASEGTEVADLSGNENHGELNDMDEPAWVAGKVQNALDLTGAEESTHIRVPHADEIAFNENKSSFTISFWMKTAALQGQEYLFNKGTFVKSNDGATGKWFGLDLKDNLIRFSVDDDVTKSEVAANNSAFLTDEWVHVVVLRDADARLLRIYLDGALLQEAADRTFTSIGNTNPLIIGNSNDLNMPFTGIIDEFKIYDYSLSQAEIAGLYAGIPMQAYQPAPAHEATDVSPDELMFSWYGDAPAYALYMGTSPDNMELVDEDIRQTSYDASELDVQTEYFWRVDAVGETETITGETWSFRTGEITGLLDPETLALFNCYPNPFSGILNISFELNKHEMVELSLYDMHNRLVGTIINSRMAPGTYKLQLDAEASWVQSLEGGMYFCVLRTSDNKYVRRVIYLKQ